VDQPSECLLVSLATYNERDNLPDLIGQIHQAMPQADILIIDDNSPDGTGAWADQAAALDPRLHVLHRPGKLGLGTAILAGMRYAMEHQFDYFLNMDADFSHHPRYLSALVVGMKDHDLMIGSRYVPGGGTLNWPITRRFMSSSVNLLARLLLRVPARDASAGFRCYRVAMLRRTRLDNLMSHGYSFQQEVLYRCCLAGCRVGEAPILFEDRRAGRSKVNYWEVLRSLGVIVWLGILAFLGLARQKFRPLPQKEKENIS
jgi:dolichol-phosphate mannosyltransferase